MNLTNKPTNLNFTVYATSFLIMITVGRVHELFPILEGVQIAKYAMIVGLISMFMSRNTQTLYSKYTSIIKLIMAIFCLAIISVSFSVYKSQSLEYISTSLLGTILLIILILKTCTSLAVIRHYLLAIVFSATLLAYGVMSEGGNGRLSVGESLDPNDLALYLISIVPLVFTQIFIVNKIKKIILSICVGLFLFAIISTGSRGGFLGLVTVVLTLFFQKMPRVSGGYYSMFNLKKILLIVAAVILMYSIAPAEYWQRIDTMSNPSQDYNVDDDRGRLAIWEQGIDMTLKYPWGIGVAAFASAQGMLEGGYYQTAHNSLIQIAGELGFLGLGLYLILFIKTIKYLNKVIVDKHETISVDTKFTAIGLRTGLFGFFISSFFLSQAYAPLLYTFYAIIDRIVVFSAPVSEK
jgi:O-antigen ligase